MSVFFDGHGTIRLKKEKASDFADKFKELSGKYDRDGKFMCIERDGGERICKSYIRQFLQLHLRTDVRLNFQHR